MVSGHKNKHRQTRQELNEKRRLRRAKKALDAEAKGLRKRRLNMRTRELLHKANGKPLAKEVLEECMLSMLALSEHRVSMTTATCAAAYAPTPGGQSKAVAVTMVTDDGDRYLSHLRNIGRHTQLSTTALPRARGDNQQALLREARPTGATAMASV